jgi:ATP-dependent DNA helicase PIF1
MSLIDKLKLYRKDKSEEKNIKPYCIYSNALMEDICNMPPQTKEELILIKGIGKKKMEDYGDDILEMCKGVKGIVIEEKQTKVCEPNPLPENIELSEQQQTVIDIYDKGENLFMTGPGGVGKSYLINLLINRFKGQKNIQVCAMTGVASELLNCDAKTIHSWSGSGLVSGKQEKVLRNILYNRKTVKNWKNVDILIVDEVSMMSVKLFEVLDKAGRYIRRVDKPFGGIQLVFSGDFYQLPPISEYNDKEGSKFCFESENWKETFPNVVLLNKIFRQKDASFMKILKQVRNGGITKKTYDILNKRLLSDKNSLEIMHTIISPIRSQVEAINCSNMEKLNTSEYIYNYSINMPPENTCERKSDVNKEIKDLEKRLNAPKELKLKVGAHVMCIANIDMESSKQIVNGSQGYIEEFIDGLPIVQFKNGVKMKIIPHSWMSEDIPGLFIKQIPLILSWAITIHKSQGITLDSAIIDAGDNIFECGQIYVAFSRVKSLEGLYLLNFNHKRIKTNLKVLQYYKSL